MSAIPVRPPIVKTVDLQTVVDVDGALVIAEAGRHFDFTVRRIFAISDVPARTLRGEHGHKTMNELLICVSGAVEVIATDGVENMTVLLDSPKKGLFIPSGIWLSQRYLRPGTVLLALCDTLYDETDYLRDYEAFLAYRERT